MGVLREDTASRRGWAPSSRPASVACAAISPSAASPTAAPTSPGDVGAGGDLDFLPGLGVRIFVKDYIGKFDVREATGFDVDTRTMHEVPVAPCADEKFPLKSSLTNSRTNTTSGPPFGREGPVPGQAEAQ